MLISGLYMAHRYIAPLSLFLSVLSATYLAHFEFPSMMHNIADSLHVACTLFSLGARFFIFLFKVTCLTIFLEPSIVMVFMSVLMHNPVLWKEYAKHSK